MPPAFVLSQDQTLHEMFFMNVQYLLIHSFASYLLALFFLSEKTELMFCPHEFVMLINHLVLFVFNCLIFKEPPSRDSYIRLSSFFLFVNTFFLTFFEKLFLFCRIDFYNFFTNKTRSSTCLPLLICIIIISKNKK